MKTGLTLKFLLGATAACVLLTVLEIAFDSLLTPLELFTHRDFEMIASWIVLLIAWAIYFLDRFCQRKQKKNT